MVDSRKGFLVGESVYIKRNENSSKESAVVIAIIDGHTVYWTGHDAIWRKSNLWVYEKTERSKFIKDVCEMPFFSATYGIDDETSIVAGAMFDAGFRLAQGDE